MLRKTITATSFEKFSQEYKRSSKNFINFELLLNFNSSILKFSPIYIPQIAALLTKRTAYAQGSINFESLLAREIVVGIKNAYPFHPNIYNHEGPVAYIPIFHRYSYSIISILKTIVSEQCKIPEINLSLGLNHFTKQEFKSIFQALETNYVNVHKKITITMYNSDINDKIILYIANLISHGKCPASLTLDLCNKKMVDYPNNINESIPVLYAALRSPQCPPNTTIHLPNQTLTPQSVAEKSQKKKFLHLLKVPMQKFFLIFFPLYHRTSTVH
jgi:hypothetical protein